MDRLRDRDGLPGHEGETVRVGSFLLGRYGFEEHLRAFHRQRANLHHAERGHRQTLIGEDLADNRLDASRVAAPGDKRTQANDRAILAQNPFEGIPELLREQTLCREWAHLEG